MKKLIGAIFVYILTMHPAWAEFKLLDYEIIEIQAKNIKVSNDGTGIVKNVNCGVCTSKTLKITKETESFVNGQPVDIVKARSKYGNRFVMVRFNTKTNEVILVRW